MTAIVLEAQYDALIRRAAPDGGFAAAEGEASRPDATAWAAMALFAANLAPELVAAARAALAAAQSPDGRLALVPGRPEAAWPTALALLAWLPDPDGAKSYPITSYTWMIFRKDNGNPAKAKAMREMVEYSLTEGQKIADSRGYIPLPQSVVDQVRKASANIQ